MVRQKNTPIAVSFANFEITRGSTEKAYVSFFNYNDQKKKVTPQFSKNQVEQVRSFFFFGGGVYFRVMAEQYFQSVCVF